MAASAGSAAPGRPGRSRAAAAAAPPERGGGSCVLCCGELEATALGKCDHPVCFRCSTKMRVLCEQRYCAVCREELRQVVFGKKLPAFATIPIHQLQYEKKYDIYFADGKVYALYRKLLQHECPLCPEQRPFSLFVDLEQHMRKQHELFCCKLCVKHLKIFTYERKWYSRKDLARHRIHGDPDDTSHRGHPLCKFCDERYLDNDELLKHLRRDHYFCHFCDSDGAQEYYSDYEYLREHFREKHFLCEEGRCNTEQFTHAFRTEIDYKAHKTSCHSRSRAEARQNRQIDLQFSYAPRHTRRGEGVVGGDDYEEVDRHNRQSRGNRPGGRGAQQNRRGSWRYKREEEDRDVAAAVRASVAARRQEEKKWVEDKEDGSRAKKDEGKDLEETRSSRRAPKPSAETSAPKEATANGSASQEDFVSFSSAAGGALQSSLQPASVKLKEEDFPSLSSSSAPTVSSGMSLTYTVTAKKTSAFQEEDFPALVSKMRPSKAVSSITSAWNNSSGKSVARSAAPVQASCSQLPKKPPLVTKGGGKASKKNNKPVVSDDEDDSVGLTPQEFRNAPTMFDVSSLLAASSSQAFIKVSKKKKMGAEKQSSASPPPQPPVSEVAAKPAWREKAPSPEHGVAPVATANGSEKPTAIVNGHSEKAAVGSVPKEPPGLTKPPMTNQCPLPQEDFPALCSAGPPRMQPPPGFNSVVLLKSPPPPPGLSPPISKPPPGFTVIPPNSISEPISTSIKEQGPCQGTYLIPENFQQRNIQLIQSIKEFLQSDESRFNKFKSHSGQFRQGRISAAQYYKSCRELLGENFKKIFSELLVLLPDTAKQQELLSAHNDFRVQEKQGAPKSRKKKSAWPASTPSELDCCICPICQQVLTQDDLGTHRALHIEDEEFPSLQAISRIIS